MRILYLKKYEWNNKKIHAEILHRGSTFSVGKCLTIFKPSEATDALNLSYLKNKPADKQNRERKKPPASVYSPGFPSGKCVVNYKAGKELKKCVLYLQKYKKVPLRKSDLAEL